MRKGSWIGFDRLEKRKTDQTFRSLGKTRQAIDFSSNDYLGLARNTDFQNAVYQAVEKDKSVLLGSTGSRLLTGNSDYVEMLEAKISRLHQCESVTLFASGYLANLTLFSSIMQRGDTILVDEDIHRSIHDGCQLGKGVKWKFKHNDVNDLERLLKKVNGTCFVAIESLYSMDGSFAPLLEVLRLCQKYQAYLIVDEAHAFGVFKRGLVDSFQLQQQIFATVITYGKALGCHGAAVLGATFLRDYIVNFGSPFIYSTSASVVQWVAISEGYDFLEKHPDFVSSLQENIRFFNQLQSYSSVQLSSPIQSIVIAGNDAVKSKARQLSNEGISVYPILSPTVRSGQERLRICLHSFNSKLEIEKLVTILDK